MHHFYVQCTMYKQKSIHIITLLRANADNNQKYGITRVSQCFWNSHMLLSSWIQKLLKTFFFLEMTPTLLFQAPNIPNPLFIEFTKTFIIHEIVKIWKWNLHHRFVSLRAFCKKSFFGVAGLLHEFLMKCAAFYTHFK